jgi:hypothetical protein
MLGAKHEACGVNADRERLAQEIDKLKADLFALMGKGAWLSGSGKVGDDSLPATMRALGERLAALESQLEAIEANRP